MSEFQNEVADRLNKARKALDNLVRQREGVDQKILRMEQVVAGLEFLTQGTGNGSRPAPAPPASEDIAFMSRHDAVTKLLKDADGPVSGQELLDRLQTMGREGDTLNGIYGVLSRLKKDRLARPWGKRGYWVWAEHMTIAAASSPAGGSSGQGEAGQGS